MNDVLALFDVLNGDDLQQARRADRMLRERLCCAQSPHVEFALWCRAASVRGGALSWRGTQCLCAVLREHPTLPAAPLAATALQRAAGTTATPGTHPAARHCALLGALQLTRAVLRCPCTPEAAVPVLAAAAAAVDAAHPTETAVEAAETAYEAARLCAAAATRLPLPEGDGKGVSATEAQTHYFCALREAAGLYARVMERVAPVFAREEAQTSAAVTCALLGDVHALKRRAARVTLVAGWLLVRAAGAAGADAGALAVQVQRVLAGVSLDEQFALLQDSDSALVKVLEAGAHAAVCTGLPLEVRCAAWTVCTGTLDRLLDLVGNDFAVITDLVCHSETHALSFLVRFLHALLSTSCPVTPVAAARYRAMLRAVSDSAQQGAFPFSPAPLVALITRYLTKDEELKDVSAESL